MIYIVSRMSFVGAWK